MDRAGLERLLDEGLSLEDIGRRLERHPSTVGYWLRKHGLEANGRERHAPRGGIECEALEDLVADGLSIRQIAAELEVSGTTVRHWLQRYGLRARAAKARATRLAELQNGERYVTKSCATHGPSKFVLEGRGYYRCVRCRAERVAAWRRRTKEQLVQEAGGRCSACGYDRYVGALQFHHLDPEQKRFSMSVRGVTRSIEAMREEMRKCVLLCSNCHAEVEGGRLSLPAHNT